jgi:hypothetical protein
MALLSSEGIINSEFLLRLLCDFLSFCTVLKEMLLGYIHLYFSVGIINNK